MNSIDKTLDERGQRYGAFTGHAQVTQLLKRAMGQHPGWRKLQDDQREALEMIAHKIGRILNGDPNYIDSWHDIIGYARLVEQRLEREQTPETQSAQKPLDFDAMLNEALKNSAESANTKKPLDFGAMLRDAIEAAEAAMPAGPDDCPCAACTLRRKLSAMFPDAEIDVTFLSEDTGRAD
jgi:hypothetical protein